ncbi:partial Bacteriophage adsorption protein A, partial [uncultured bacterium]
VAWISERKDVLCAMFFLSSILFYLRYAQKGKAFCYILSLMAFALAIMSKSMAVTLPAVLLLVDFYPLRRLSSAKGVLKAVAEKLPFFAISAFAAVMAVYSQSSSLASLAAAPFDVRVVTALRAYVFYLEKLFVPLGLAPYYPYQLRPDPFGFKYLVAYGVLAGISIGCLAAIRYRAFIVTWLYFLGTLLPVIGFVQVGVQAAADRYMYIPSLSLLVLIGAGSALIVERNSRALLGALLALISVVTVGLSYATVKQAAIWKDSLTLWDYELAVYPDAGELAIMNRGVAYKKAGRYKEALADLNEAINLKPSAMAYSNRGNVRKRMGDIPGSIEDYIKALELDPQDAATYFNFALVLEESGDITWAIENADKAERLGLGQAREYLEHLKASYPAGAHE